MINFIINAIKIIFLLGFLIIIHEGGHFLVAKLCKVKVNEFSIGFGKHKFSEVSPKKSIEGCIGGTLSAIILVLIYTLIINKVYSFNYSYIYISIATLILSIIGQIGDFAASSIKRYVNVKDYSNLIPGHGGMLDRIDSLMFLTPFACAFFNML